MKTIIWNKQSVILAFALPFVVEGLLLAVDTRLDLGPWAPGGSPQSFAAVVVGLSVLSGITFLPRGYRLWPLVYVLYVPLMATVLFIFPFAFGALVFGGP